MADSPSSEKKDTPTEPPAPEVLRPQAEKDTPATETSATPAATSVSARPRRTTYRPSHKATFIGAAVVVAVLAVNVGVITFVMRGQNLASSQARQDAVTLSPATLDSLGVTRTPVANLGTELVVGPNSRFNGKVTIGSDVSIGGRLQLNSKFSAADASLTKLEAGDTALGQLNVNGDGTVTTLNTRRDLNVAGATRLQGPVTISQLLTVNNSLNVIGNLAVGGTLTARGFQASSLISDTTLVIGGHIITRGNAPGVSPGGALGSNGTVSISGNDVAGTVAANIGVGASSGTVASVSFRQAYSSTPHIVVSAVGRSAGNFYINRSANGFSIVVTGPLAPGGHAFDYIVMQ